MNEGVPKAEVVQPPPEKIKPPESIETAVEREMREDTARTAGEMARVVDAGGDALSVGRAWKERWEARIAAAPENLRLSIYFHCQIGRLLWQVGDQQQALDAFEHALDQFEARKIPELQDLYERMYHKYVELSGNMTYWVEELTALVAEATAEGQEGNPVAQKIDTFTSRLEEQYDQGYLNRTRTYLLLKGRTIPDAEIRWFDLPDKLIEKFIREELGAWQYKEAPSTVLMPPRYRFKGSSEEVAQDTPEVVEVTGNFEGQPLKEKIVALLRERGTEDPFTNPQIRSLIDEWTDVVQTEAIKNPEGKARFEAQLEMGDMFIAAGDFPGALLIFMWIHYQISHEKEGKDLLPELKRKISDISSKMNSDTVEEIRQKIEEEVRRIV